MSIELDRQGSYYAVEEKHGKFFFSIYHDDGRRIFRAESLTSALGNGRTYDVRNLLRRLHAAERATGAMLP